MAHIVPTGIDFWASSRSPDLLEPAIIPEIYRKIVYSKTCLKLPLQKRTKIGFQDLLLLDEGQKYSAILLTFIELPFVFKTFVLSIFEWSLKTGFNVFDALHPSQQFFSHVGIEPVLSSG